MSRQPKSTSDNDSTEATEAPKRKRTAMHTARIVKAVTGANVQRYVAMLDGKVTAMYEFNVENAELSHFADEMGMYEGFPRYYRQHAEGFQLVLLTKAVDVEVVAAQVDPYTVESFLRSYLDRLTVKSQLALNEQYGKEVASVDNI